MRPGTALSGHSIVCAAPSMKGVRLGANYFVTKCVTIVELQISFTFFVKRDLLLVTSLTYIAAFVGASSA